METWTLDIEKLGEALSRECGELSFALLFGSAVDATIRTGSDVDVAVYFSGEDRINADNINRIASLVEKFSAGADADLTILNHAGPIVAFEALKGKILFIREEAEDVWAGFYSLTCREYEDETWWRKQQLRYRGYGV